MILTFNYIYLFSLYIESNVLLPDSWFELMDNLVSWNFVRSESDSLNSTSLFHLQFFSNLKADIPARKKETPSSHWYNENK